MILRDKQIQGLYFELEIYYISHLTLFNKSLWQLY